MDRGGGSLLEAKLWAKMFSQQDKKRPDTPLARYDGPFQIDQYTHVLDHLKYNLYSVVGI